MLRILNFTAFAGGAVALLSAVWIVVPAPHPSVWLFAVAASEWSLWLAMLALIAIIGALAARYFSSGGLIWFVSLVVGIAALAISLYPLLSVVSVAREKNVSLSLGRYFSAVTSSRTPIENFKTYTFARAGGADLQLDVYAPTVENANNGASVVVVHGGSWSGGGRSDFPEWNRWLAANGYTIFDVDYRLAPPPNYLTATGDVKCAVRWVKNHAAEFNVNPERIALLGRSAGAHLALLAAYSADDKSFPATCADNQPNEAVRAVVSFYAPADLLWAFDHPANEAVIDGKGTLAAFLGGSPHESNEMRDRYVSAAPLAHISLKTPPTFLIHGGQDQLVRDENMRFLDEKLNELKVPHETLLIRYAQHGFDYNFKGFGSQIVQPLLLDFLGANTAAE